MQFIIFQIFINVVSNYINKDLKYNELHVNVE